MKQINLTSACNITTGKLDANAAIINGKYPYFTCASEPLQINEYAFDEKAILLAGNNASGNFHCQRYDGKFNAYQRTYVITAKDGYDIDYIYYSILISLEQLKKKSQGSQTKFITMEILDNFYINDIELYEQKRMVLLLLCIDNKIKLNKKINDNLQNQMQTLYDYWFVQFDFPNKDGKPYKSSGGKMVWNETLRQNIPEAWTIRKLSRIINISNERISPSEIKDRVYVPIEVIPRKRISFYETADTSKATTGLCPFAAKAILLSNRRVYFHKVCISPFDGVTRDTVIIITPNEESNLGFIFETVFSEHFINYATKNSYGSEQPVLSPTAVMDYVIAYPNDSLDHSYSNIVNEMIDQVLMNEKENKQLLELRNLLLPLLMTGQATIE